MTGKAKTYRAEAAIELSSPLFLGPEFSGLLKSATIGGVDVQIVLPSFKRDIVEVGTVLHPRAQFDWLDFFGRQDTEGDRDWPFGGVSRWERGGRGGIGEFSAHRLLAMPREPLTLAEARKFKAAVDDWVSLFETWIEVVAREDLHRRHVWVERQGQSAVLWIDRGKEPQGDFLPGEHRIMLNLGGSLAVTPWQWGKMLAKASDGTAPPEAHVFLRDARHSMNLGHHRRSVLDSATAAELSLAKLRDDCLSKSNTRLASYIREKARQIDGLSRFLKDMGRNLPDQLENISGPRNKAIHAGHELDNETAETAIQKTEEVVDLAFPWKKLL